MNLFTRVSAVIGAIALTTSTTAFAQVDFPELEPNGPKAEATTASCLVAGDTLSGLSTGTSITAGNTADASADTFRVKTCPLSLGIYKHEFVITTAGTVGHTGTIRGLTQTGAACAGGTIVTTSDSAIQTSSTATTPPRRNLWYGFGKEEELYYRITGGAATTTAYTSTMSTTAVSPITIGPFAAGSITITTCAQGHSTDTEVYVYDANLSIVPTFLNDDQCPAACVGGPTFGSTLTRTYPAGRYYLAMGTFSTSADQPAPVDDRVPTAQTAWDFPNGISRSSTTAAAVINFAVTDSAGTTPVLATTTGAYEIVWYKFDVVPPSSIVAMCEPGVGGVMACVCGNPNGAGVGCSNTGGPGAAISGAGTPDVSTDSLVLTGSGMFSGAACIFLQGNALVAGGTTFGAGIRCAGGSLKRLYIKGITGGMSIAPVGADLTISAQSAALGDVITNGYRWYQVYYRDPNLVNPGGACPPIATFNSTSGVEVYWLP